MNHPTVVVGGGISGISAAVEIAECGREVVLVEKEPYLGGNVARFQKYFPKLCPPACGLEINFRRIRSNPRITYYTGAEVTGICGTEGAFSVNIRLKPRLINNQCTACGKCAESCPEGAAGIPGNLAFPLKYHIDPDICQRQDCRKCIDVCDYDAIHLDAEGAEIIMQASRIILASGWKSYDAGRIENYAYSGSPDILTNLEFETLLAESTRTGKPLLRPSDGKEPASVAFVQCAGSRDEKHLGYCSAVCCGASLKHALSLSEEAPAVRTEIFYIDLRVQGRNEKLLKKAESKEQIRLTKGKVGKITPGEGNYRVEAEDILHGGSRKEDFDMVVLATGLVANQVPGTLRTSKEGFYLAEQEKGISAAGCCKRPMDVSSSVKDATAASLISLQS